MAVVPTTFICRCSVCGQEHREEVDLDAALPFPGPPPKWIVVNEYLVCDRHEADLTITNDGDGQVIYKLTVKK